METPPPVAFTVSWHEFHHEAMATDFALFIADPRADYARQAATAAWRELDRLETELSRYLESSDIARANRLACGDRTVLGPDAFECLLLAADVALATDGAFDAAYASSPLAAHQPPGTPRFALDPATHTLTSLVDRLHLDLGAIGKGYALDVLAALLTDWGLTRACLQSGGSTALALEPPTEATGWPVNLDVLASLPLARSALSGSGTAVRGAHLIDPRTGHAAKRPQRVWALAPSAALADALSTAFFVWSDAEIARFCTAQPEIGAAVLTPRGLMSHGPLASALTLTPEN